MSGMELEAASRKAVLAIHDKLKALIEDCFHEDFDTFRKLHPQWLGISALLEDTAQRKLFLEELSAKPGYAYLYSALLNWMFDVWDMRKAESPAEASS